MPESVRKIEDQYVAAFQLHVEEGHGSRIADLNAKYLAALTKAFESASKGNRLEEALAVKEEIRRVESKEPLPDIDEGIHPALIILRRTFREQLDKLMVARAQAAAPIVKKFDEALAAQQSVLTQAGQVDEAAAVKAYREAGVAGKLLGEVTPPLSSGTGTSTLRSGSAQQQGTIPTNGLVSWWRAEGNTRDAMGKNNGRAHGDVGFAKGVVGEAFEINGGYVEVRDSPSLRFGPDLPATITAWVYRTNNTLPFHILGKRLPGREGGQGTYQLGIDRSWPETPLNRWAFWTLVNTASGSRVYVDAKLIRSQKSFDVRNSAPFRIGTSGDYAGVCGLIDEVRVYDRDLSDAEIQALYAEQGTQNTAK